MDAAIVEVGPSATNLTEARRTSPPLRFLRWVWSWCLPGMGMFNEAYYIFSVGNLKPIWQAEYPACWQDNVDCSPTFLEALNYSQVAGLFLGMVAMGLVIDRIGRKWGSITTAGIMFIGGVLLTAASGSTPHNLFLFLTAAQAVFGFGVGGEFPVAASSASERAEASQKLKALRGQTVVLVFSMQAWGNILNLVVLLTLLAALGQTAPPYNSARLSLTWRLQYGLGLVLIAFMLCHRFLYLKESQVWQDERRKKQEAKLLATKKAGLRASTLIRRFYWHRWLGTALGWFAWDFYYYGNKLFQSEFIGIIQPGSSLIGLLEFNLLNSVALFGYYAAAFTIDKPWMGRRRMQIMGFGWIFALFLICGAAFSQLTSSPGRLRIFQALYYLSSFWGQFGPNASTFLLASELFPTEIRGAAHGSSAAVGKLGALAADIILGKVGDRPKFFLCAGAGALGILVTVLFIPEITTLDLSEGDRRWDALKSGATDTYHGEAVNPSNLSWYEAVRGYGRSHAPASSSDDNMNIARTTSNAGAVLSQRRQEGKPEIELA